MRRAAATAADGLLCLVLLLLLEAPSPAGGEADPCPVTWDPTVRALVATDSPADALPDAGALLLWQLLRSPTLHVEVAVARPGLFERHCRALNLTVRLAYVFERERNLFRGFLDKLQRKVQYTMLVWMVTNLSSLLLVRSFPGCLSVLWVRGSLLAPVPASGFPFQDLLRFEVVWFDNLSTLTACARLVNPLGHIPPMFRLLADREDFQLQVETLARQMPGSPLGKQPPFSSIPGTLAVPPVPRPLRCPRRRTAKLAVVIHFGTYLQNVTNLFFATVALMPNLTHLWVTYTDPVGLSVMSRLARRRLPVIHPLGVTERGRHLGPFFMALWQIATCKYKYQYLLKLHLLRNNEPASYSPITLPALEQPGWVPGVLQYLDTTAHIMALYPTPPKFPELRYERDTLDYDWDNRYYMKLLTDRLGLTWTDFVIRTSVWIARTSALAPLLGNASFVQEEYTALAEPDGLDWHWYNFVYLGDACTRTYVEQHFLHVGVPSATAGNPGTKNVPRTKTLEGARTSAWERVFSFMFTNAGKFEPFALPQPPMEDD
eukprot:EG_transcript_6972